MQQRLAQHSHRFIFMAKTSIWMMVLSFCLGGLSINVHAEDNQSDGETPSQPWHISADQIHFDQAEEAYAAVGNVVVTREGRTLTADTVRLSQKTQEAVAEGNVRLVSGDDVLTGRYLRLNLDTETGVLTDGLVFISPNHFYLSGDQIRKTGPSSYSIQRASVTTCDGKKPAWRLTCRDLKVTIEGYGFAKHAALWARKMPVLYSPYMVFPVKLKRQSGLLTPEFGQSDRKGNQYLQPLFWAINASSDATFYAHYMSERGTRSGLEYRYVLDETSLGTIMADGFQDQHIDDGQGDASERWGYEESNVDVLRPNNDRYWLRAKLDQSAFWGLTARLDLDVVSDQDYLHEFKSGYYGFGETRDYFQKTFGREIDDFNESVRLNRLNLSRTWTSYSFNTDLRWYDDVIKRRDEEEDNDTLQHLPAITFDGIKHKIGGSPLYFDLTSEYIHFFREYGDRGQRADLYPRLYYPKRLLNALSIEPSAGLRQTAWRIDHHETPSSDQQDTFYRTIYDLKLDMSTDFFRVFDLDVAGCDRLKHNIRPQVIYTYTPDDDQSELPDALGDPTIAAQNLITYSITNTFTARKPKDSEKGKGADFSYHPFLRFKLEQSFDINEHNEDKDDPQPYSDIAAELDITPGRYVSLDADASWSVYDMQFQSHNAALTLWDARGDRLRTEYRYTRETDIAADDGIESIYLEGELQIMDRWLLRGSYERNLYTDTEIETHMGITYQSQCWGIDLDYRIEEEDRSYTATINLLGLGSIGN